MALAISSDFFGGVTKAFQLLSPCTMCGQQAQLEQLRDDTDHHVLCARVECHGAVVVGQLSTDTLWAVQERVQVVMDWLMGMKMRVENTVTANTENAQAQLEHAVRNIVRVAPRCGWCMSNVELVTCRAVSLTYEWKIVLRCHGHFIERRIDDKVLLAQQGNIQHVLERVVLDGIASLSLGPDAIEAEVRKPPPKPQKRYVKQPLMTRKKADWYW